MEDAHCFLHIFTSLPGIPIRHLHEVTKYFPFLFKISQRGAVVSTDAACTTHRSQTLKHVDFVGFLFVLRKYAISFWCYIWNSPLECFNFLFVEIYLKICNIF